MIVSSKPPWKTSPLGGSSQNKVNPDQEAEAPAGRLVRAVAQASLAGQAVLVAETEAAAVLMV